MCDFISGYKLPDGTLHFHTDEDVEAAWERDGKTEPIPWQDMVGHSGYHSVFGPPPAGSVEVEGKRYLIDLDIRRYRKLMLAAGYESITLRDAELVMAGHKLHAEADKLYAEGRNLHKKAKKLYAEAGKLHEEAGKLHEEGNKLSAEAGKLYEEGHNLCTEGNELWAEAGSLCMEANRLFARACNLRADADKLCFTIVKAS